MQTVCGRSRLVVGDSCNHRWLGHSRSDLLTSLLERLSERTPHPWCYPLAQEWACSTLARTFLSPTSRSQQVHEKVYSLSPLSRLALNTHFFLHLYFWGLPSAFCILLCSVMNNAVVPIPTDFSIPYTDLELTTLDVTLPLNVSLDLGSTCRAQHDLAAIDTDPCLVTCYEVSQGPKALGRRML